MKTLHQTPSKRSSGGFSLIELLIVIALIALVTSLAGPAMQGMLGANRITQGGENIVSTLSLARQYAVSKNREVEVRFIICAPLDGGVSGSSDVVRAVQIVERQDDGTWKPTTRPRILPSGVIGWGNASDSTVLAIPAVSATSGDPVMGALGRTYSYRPFRFKADGSTDLAQILPGKDNYCLTLIEEKRAGGSLPENYLAIVIQPRTGGVTVWRP